MIRYVASAYVLIHNVNVEMQTDTLSFVYTDVISSSIVLQVSYRADVPDLQGFVIRCRHQEVGVRGPGHVRYALKIHGKQSGSKFFLLCNHSTSMSLR